eukprot:4825714-Pleurochrysis_carterae.AAC.6
MQLCALAASHGPSAHARSQPYTCSWNACTHVQRGSCMLHGELPRGVLLEYMDLPTHDRTWARLS